MSVKTVSSPNLEFHQLIKFHQSFQYGPNLILVSMTSGSPAAASSSSISSPALTLLYSSVSSVHSSTRPVDPSLQWNECSFSSLGVVSHSCSETRSTTTSLSSATLCKPAISQLSVQWKKEHLESPPDWVSSVTQFYFTFIPTDLFFLSDDFVTLPRFPL